MSSDGSMTGDSGMVRVMGMVVLALIGIAVSIGLVANILSANAEDDPNDPLMRNALVQRLEPIGKVRTSADELEVAEADAGGSGDAPGVAVAAAPGPQKTGEELVEGACANCHAAGVAGAPMLGDADAWGERREKGYEALVASVINGLNAMPARGGSTYTDEEIGLAVSHIAMFPEGEGAPAAEPAAAEPAADAAPAAEPVADAAAAPAADAVPADAAPVDSSADAAAVVAATDGSEPVDGAVAADEAAADADGVEIPETRAEANAIPASEAVTDPSVQGSPGEATDGAEPIGAAASDPADQSRPAPDVGDQANDMAADESSAMAGGDTNDMRADEASDGTVTVRDAPGTKAQPESELNANAALTREVQDEVVPAADAVLAVGGPAPEGMSDRVETTVDGVCSGCHIAGVANAPKFSDAAAWQERADKGLAALTQSVINGIGVMPARGGSDLSDEEIPTAVQYMLSKAGQ